MKNKKLIFLTLLKFKNFCFAKDSVKRMRRQTVDTFAKNKQTNKQTDKRPLSRLHRELLKHINKKIKSPIKK